MENKKINVDKFIQKHKELLDLSGRGRTKHFRMIIEKLVALNKPLTIVETGTLWAPLDKPMGAFTYIFGDLIKNHTGGKLITIDINPKHIENAKHTTKEFKDVIEYITSDSVKYLESMSDEEVESHIYANGKDLNQDIEEQKTDWDDIVKPKEEPFWSNLDPKKTVKVLDANQDYIENELPKSNKNKS